MFAILVSIPIEHKYTINFFVIFIQPLQALNIAFEGRSSHNLARMFYSLSFM